MKARAEPKTSVRIFGTSATYGSKTARRIGKMIREHWSVENLNHWKRDSSNWREDLEPKRNPQGARNLALMRNALLAVIPFEQFASLNDAFDHCRDQRDQAVKITKTARPCKDSACQATALPGNVSRMHRQRNHPLAAISSPDQRRKKHLTVP